jgi:predicted ATPase
VDRDGLDRSFGVLAAGPRGAVARHQTLRATIDWSFQLLAEPEQRLLARLAVFVGGATSRPLRRSAVGRASIPARCSSCWRA